MTQPANPGCVYFCVDCAKDIQSIRSMTDNESSVYDVVIIGAGASGSALLYTLATYTTISKIALVEKYDRPGQVNSNASNNSQTLHVGDIETNYPLEKARQVKAAASMVARYAEHLPEAERERILFPVQKMVLGVGEEQVRFLEKRYEDVRTLFPDLEKLDRVGISRWEPKVIEGRSEDEPILALGTKEGYAVDFEQLAQSFIDHALRKRPDLSLRFGQPVVSILRDPKGIYTLNLKRGSSVKARTVVADTDSYSLLLAKQLGYGQHFSLIPIAGTFYFSRQILHGKVYTVQEPRLPFAAVHGDPDVRVPHVTRWGPTARFHPVLESRNFKTSLDYLRSSGLNHLRTWVSFFKILLDPVRFMYLLKNMLYEFPWIGKRLFIHHIQKIVPTIQARDIETATGYGGMRLQRVDTRTHELQLGEGKIVGEHIIFNMTPSPGASVCLYNAMRDTETLITFLDQGYAFDEARMKEELFETLSARTLEPTSLPEGYAS